MSFGIYCTVDEFWEVTTTEVELCRGAFLDACEVCVVAVAIISVLPVILTTARREKRDVPSIDRISIPGSLDFGLSQACEILRCAFAVVGWIESSL